MSVSAVGSGAASVQALQFKPQGQPQKAQTVGKDVDGDNDNSTPAQAAAEKSGSIDVKG